MIGYKNYISYVLFRRLERQSSHMDTIHAGVTAPGVIIASVIAALHVHAAAHSYITATRSVVVAACPWPVIKV